MSRYSANEISKCFVRRINNIFTKSVCNLWTYVWILSRIRMYKNILQRERPITEKEKNLSGPINSFLIKNFHFSRVDNRMSRFVDDMPTNHRRTDEQSTLIRRLIYFLTTSHKRIANVKECFSNCPSNCRSKWKKKNEKRTERLTKPYPDAYSFTNFPRNDRNRVRFCLKRKTDKGLDEE